MAYWNVLDSRYLDRPTDWEAIFSRNVPLIIEIGFGRGDHLIHLGKTHPDYNIVGIEISRPSLKKASSKVRTNQLTNVRVLDGSAPQILWENVSPNAISELHINFPDPWHKEGHQRRRLINLNFLHLAASRMPPDAHLHVATDHPDYQPVVTACLEQTPYFENRHPSTYLLDLPQRFRTKYEQKALREGRVPFYYQWRRNATAVANQFAIPENLPMPHAVIATPLEIATIADRFTPQDYATEGINVRFLAVYHTHNTPQLLVETYISQEPQHQRLGLTITERDPQQFIIQLHDIGFPRPTDGVHFAVSCLAQWLQTLHPESKIVRHNLKESLSLQERLS